MGEEEQQVQQKFAFKCNGVCINTQPIVQMTAGSASDVCKINIQLQTESTEG